MTDKIPEPVNDAVYLDMSIEEIKKILPTHIGVRVKFDRPDEEPPVMFHRSPDA
jgi:hypothetical protein